MLIRQISICSGAYSLSSPASFRFVIRDINRLCAIKIIIPREGEFNVSAQVQSVGLEVNLDRKILYKCVIYEVGTTFCFFYSSTVSDK